MLFHSNGLPILGAGVNIEGNKGLLSSVKERDAMWVYKRLMVLWLVTGSVTIGAEALDTPPGLITQWADQVTADSVWPQYPRPALTRKHWQNLNGLWQYAITSKEADKPEVVDGEILVPFAVESQLSQVRRRVTADQALWYRRTFTLPSRWRDDRILLHFGAVDWEATVWVNDQQVGFHRGGYDPFTLDITEALQNQGQGPQTVVVRVWDPTDQGSTAPARGKQTLHPAKIFYTAVTGIWQTVWLEPVPQAYIRDLHVTTDIETGRVTVNVDLTGDLSLEPLQVVVKIKEGWFVKAKTVGEINEPVVLTLSKPKLWSPDRPFLYDLDVVLETERNKEVDRVDSYVGLRKIHVAPDHKGVPRLFLNNEPLFQFGLLDQGWWPDGLYTAPTDQALRYDIDVTKQLGYNLIRKHVKVEPQRFYSWCDRLGILVWQDMASRLFERDRIRTDRLQTSDQQWEGELKAMMDHLRNHPSIVMWVPFNEAWGQYDTERVTEWIKSYDPTRLVNSASGWDDKQVGDVRDVHVYPGPNMGPIETERAMVLGEFGGLALGIEGHVWRQSQDNWGYRSLPTAEALKEDYARLIVDLYGLKDRGLAAAVYTQTTDCEVEINGVMTYDREVIKMDPSWAHDLNQGYLPPWFDGERTGFLDRTRVTLLSRDPYATIRYTLDGSEPTGKSARYTGAILIEEDALVRARCFWKGGKESVTVSKAFVEMNHPMLPVDPNLTSEGLVYEVFKGHWVQLPHFENLTPEYTDVTRMLNLADIEETTDFAVRMRGLIRVPRTGVYRFSVHSDDGSRLAIGDQILVDNDGTHVISEASGEIALCTGWHPIELLYFQGKGGKGLNVFFEGPHLSKRIVPPSALGY